MRLARETITHQGALQENEVTTVNRFEIRRYESTYFDFECIVLGIAKTIEPDTEKLMDWYRNTPIMEIDALTAERLVLRGRGNEVITFLNSILVGVR
jgi:hypothetical protein